MSNRGAVDSRVAERLVVPQNRSWVGIMRTVIWER